MENLNHIRLFITDIDGVWTDGGMYYDGTDMELKKFNTYDSAGVLFLRLFDIPVAIITGENTEIVKRRAQKLKIEDCHLGIKDKVAVGETLLAKYDLNWEEVAYLGDDLNDIKIMEQVGLSACPSQAPEYIKDRVDWKLTKAGGEGVFREFVERFLEERGLLEEAVSRYLSGKSHFRQ